MHCRVNSRQWPTWATETHYWDWCLLLPCQLWNDRFAFFFLIDDGYLTVSYGHESDNEEAPTASNSLSQHSNSLSGIAAAAMPCPAVSPSNIGGASSSTLRQQQQHPHPSNAFSANIKHELSDKLPVTQSIFTLQVGRIVSISILLSLGYVLSFTV